MWIILDFWLNINKESSQFLILFIFYSNWVEFHFLHHLAAYFGLALPIFLQRPAD